MLPNSDGMKSDRMPVVVSGKGVEKLLGIPGLANISGDQTRRKIVHMLQEWTGVAPLLAGLGFDTSASNTVVHRGVITVVQAVFNRRLLYFACQHCILELLVNVKFGIIFISIGQEIALL